MKQPWSLPFYLVLLPVFFVIHGMRENYASIPVAGASMLALWYVLASLVLACLGWLIFRNPRKGSIFALSLMAFQFFFGSLQDGIKSMAVPLFFSRYSFLLTVFLLLFIALWFYLKRSRRYFQRTGTFLNLVLLVLIMVEAGIIVIKDSSAPYRGIISFDNDRISSDQPDIYFIILDGYSGSAALQKAFGFNNAPFENELKRKGYSVAVNSSSNYNYTPFSMASMLQMDYLDLNMKTKGPGNLQRSYAVMRKSKTLKFLESKGYRFHNYSAFDFDGAPALGEKSFLPRSTELITARSFTARVWKDVLFNTSTGKWKLGFLNKKIVYAHLRNNRLTMEETLRLAKEKTGPPRFVYSHLMMPHYPYYFNSSGASLPYDSLVEGTQYSSRNYLQYLQYCNKRILSFSDSLVSISSRSSVIILASDHGFRYFNANDNRRFCFSNLAAVRLSSGKTIRFYEGLTMVNFFPVLFNEVFEAHFPLQKDSTIYLWD